MITVERVSQWYGNVVALSDVSLKFQPGVTGLLGPNGAGKSSLIKLLTGQLKARIGRVTVDGRVPWRDGRVLGQIGYAPEGDVFYPRLTGRQFVHALLGLSGIAGGRARELADDAIEKVGMSEAADRPVGGYSKGMKQRIKVAQAIAHDPQYLFLDEPFEGTDPFARRALMDLVLSLGRSGKVVLLSSHVLHEVEAMTQEIVLLSKGKVLASGQVAEIRGLLDGYPLQIELDGPAPRELAAELVGLPDVLSVEFEGERRLRLRTRNPNACYDAIGRFGAQGRIERVVCPDEGLEAVFEYLAG